MADCIENVSMLNNWNTEEKVKWDCLKLNDRAWHYRGEGNANIVIALQDDVRVIRLSKVKTGKVYDDYSQHRKKVEREVLFANQIFGPLLGSEFVGTVHAVQINYDQIAELNSKLLKVRPNYRQHKELRVPFGTSHCDFARIHDFPSSSVNYCVEIKPKQGWWPKKIHVGNQSSPYCTYCLNQHLKLSRSKISSVTNYCPLDLFSGQSHRMIGAVISLIANPQNNLRIFRDGTLVYGDAESDYLDQILVEWFFGGDNQMTKKRPFTNENPKKFPMWKITKALQNFICMLCLALLNPRSEANGGTFQDRELYEELKSQIQDILKCSPQTRSQQQQQPQVSHVNGNSRIMLNRNDNPYVSISNRISNPKKYLEKPHCSAVSLEIPESCILSRILKVQQLGQLSGRCIYSIYQKICPVHNEGINVKQQLNKKRKASSDDSPEFCDFVSKNDNANGSVDDMSPQYCNSEENLTDGGLFLCHRPNNFEKVSDVDILSSNKYDENLICPSIECLANEKWLDEIPNSNLNLTEYSNLKHYLLSATAKDCSIMITFSPINRGGPPNPKFSHVFETKGLTKSSHEPLYQQNHKNATNCGVCDHMHTYKKSKPTGNSNIYGDSDMVIEDMMGGSHRVRIGVADLDPKPLTSIVKHYIRDIEMVEAYRITGSNGLAQF